ncbi:uncharacterized protein LOC118478313 [Aplysia californica]|uniref:Uncharacterized protein LOC118478313 n=1 Tax=Aplysia californica TaxID=6500 RepID=A0ABM1VYW6_APLCA|nr:uncharacterized protein LOC118478313 [Aplysia californica]
MMATDISYSFRVDTDREEQRISLTTTTTASDVILVQVVHVTPARDPPSVEGSARLIEPAMRSSIWRFDSRANVNFNDHTLDCGGGQIQHRLNGGRCGVCGDAYTGSRDNELGGRYDSGIIARRYRMGSDVTMVVDVLAPRGGYFEVKLCPRDDPNVPVTQDCFNGYPLRKF